ncbi:YheC/YheD family protein [Ectobacillus sp. sgz5001026]|uniref:YheC/YheD family endospore coat-associated protein n=1 Tax=Ectobacillus sp. sgz5001026 TaxID=3242473 RepID=UPI0036D20A4A
MLGLLSLRIHQEHEYFTEIAKRSKRYQIPVVRFTPSHIDPSTEMVTGLLFNHETQDWKKETFPLPSYIYDRCFYNQSSASKAAKPIVEWLKKRPQTVFLGHGLPDKLQLYSILSKNPMISPYLPITKQATIDRVWNTLLKTRELVLKPMNGSQGNGYCHLSLRRHEINIKMQQKEIQRYTFSSKDAFLTWLSKLLQDKPYIQQPFLSIQENSQPFDIRILLQKNEEGLWTEAGRAVRIGEAHSLVSNLAAGSQPISYDEWKRTLAKHTGIMLEEAIVTLIKTVPETLEKELPPLFELGLDLSLDRGHAVWLLDINSKPGRKVLLASNPSCKEQLYGAPLAYCRYLARHSKGADVR